MSSEPSPRRSPRLRRDVADPYAELWEGVRANRRKPRQRSRRHTFRVTIVSVIAVVVAGLLAVPLVQQWMPAKQGTGVSTLAAENGPSAQPGVSGKPGSPFAGTPAEAYARGTAGVVPPPATKVGGWSASQVKQVLTRTRDVLVAARLDPAVVEQGDPTKYLQLLAPATRPMVRSSIEKGGPGLGYVTRLAPGFQLDRTAAVRVAGKMTANVGRYGQLVVMADYVWVYPLKGGKAQENAGPGSTLVVLHTVESYEWYRPEAISTADRGLRPGGGNSYTFNMDCTLVGKGLLALPPPGQGGRPSSPNDAAYSPTTKPESIPSTC
jgi:hypothetical protein